MDRKTKNILLVISLVLLIAVSVFLMRNEGQKRKDAVSDVENPIVQEEEEDEIGEEPNITTSDFKTGLDHPWDIGFLSNDAVIFTQRKGEIRVIDGQKDVVLEKIPEVEAKGEGGLLGLAVDPKYKDNGYVYICYGTDDDVKVSRLKLDGEYKVEATKDIVTGIPVNKISGRHSGCQLEFDGEENLFVSTGDTANGTLPQDPKSLGGKILRIDRDGNAVKGNIGGEFDERIYSYGHRNVQGLIIFKQKINGLIGASIEHGPGKDDEVNPLIKGNFGWNPVPLYNERVPMTDKEKYSDAIEALWSSGDPTVATSGGTQINGEQWGSWDGSISIACLKGSQVKLLRFEGEKLIEFKSILSDIGRIRTVQQGPDGDLYVLTDNGGNGDRIIRVSIGR